MKSCIYALVISAGIIAQLHAAGPKIPERVADWIETDVKLPGISPLWYAANNLGTLWDVYLDGNTAKVRKYERGDSDSMITVSGGKLSSNNRGEWGSTVYWTPKSGQRMELSKHPVVQFFSHSKNILAIAWVGNAHSPDFGEVLKFSKSENSWTITRFSKLPDRPRLAISEGTESFLVLTSSTLCRVSNDGEVQVLVKSAPWEGLHPSSLIVDGARFAYVGFSQRIAKVNLETLDTKYLIPYKEIFDDDLKAYSK